MRHFSMIPKKEVPPDLTPRFPDFVVQLAFGPKWPHTKFGVKPLKPGGGLPSKMCFSPVWLFFRDAFVSLLYLCCLLLVKRQT